MISRGQLNGCPLLGETWKGVVIVLTKITGRHMEVTEAMRSYIEKKIAKLQRYYNRISEMEVIVEEEGLHH